jgi:predicted metal-dependent phosphoesterase TrpH
MCWGFWFGPPLPPRERGTRLQHRLTTLLLRRRERFRDFVRLLRAAGHSVGEQLASATEAVSVSLGRGHMANLVVRAGLARNRREAWGRFVAPLGARAVPKLRVPFAEGTELIHDAGGVAVLAHPSAELSESDFAAMKEAGLNGVETKFPAAGVGRTVRLSEMAEALGLLTTGGSDCHGPAGRPVGAVGATAAELRAVCGEAAGEGNR